MTLLYSYSCNTKNHYQLHLIITLKADSFLSTVWHDNGHSLWKLPPMITNNDVIIIKHFMITNHDLQIILWRSMIICSWLSQWGRNAWCAISMNDPVKTFLNLTMIIYCKDVMFGNFSLPIISVFYRIPLWCIIIVRSYDQEAIHYTG